MVYYECPVCESLREITIDRWEKSGLKVRGRCHETYALPTFTTPPKQPTREMLKQRTIILAACVAVTGIQTACGGSPDSTGPTGPTKIHPEDLAWTSYVQQVPYTVPPLCCTIMPDTMVLNVLDLSSIPGPGIPPMFALTRERHFSDSRQQPDHWTIMGGVTRAGNQLTFTPAEPFSYGFSGFTGRITGDTIMLDGDGRPYIRVR
jgi:hypothetical protein